jgi:hypothetical protein
LKPTSSCDLDEVGAVLRGNFAGKNDQPGFHQCFQRDAGIRVLSNQRIEDGVGNLIAHLVRMAFGDGFRSEKKVFYRHERRLLGNAAETIAARKGVATA